jgi:hypothetical protein
MTLLWKKGGEKAGERRRWAMAAAMEAKGIDAANCGIGLKDGYVDRRAEKRGLGQTGRGRIL